MLVPARRRKYNPSSKVITKSARIAVQSSGCESNIGPQFSYGSTSAQPSCVFASATIAPVSKVDLYNNTYGNSGDETYRQVRLETYGQDFGQTSWTTVEEFKEIASALELRRESHVIEIGSGAGGCAIHFAESAGCRVTGVDVNREGVQSAAALAESKALCNQANFLQHDVSKAFRSNPAYSMPFIPTMPSATFQIAPASSASAFAS